MSVEIEIVIQFLYQQEDKRLKVNATRGCEADELPLSTATTLGRCLAGVALKGVNVAMATGGRRRRCAKLLDNRRANCLPNDNDNDYDSDGDGDNVAKFPETIET